MKKNLEELEGVIKGYNYVPRTTGNNHKLSITFQTKDDFYILNDPKKDPKDGKSWFRGYGVEGPDGSDGLLAMLDTYKTNNKEIKVMVSEKKGYRKVHEMDFEGTTYELF